ncbi:MAG: sugar phosphate nucleotidyltransferase [Pseudomonadota bacterium]
MQAMILAAGFGTRLLPHTRVRPKPLFPILNQPLLLFTIKRLQNLGFDHIVVNCHHLRQQIVAALSGLPGVVVQEEETILGTGGGLRRALDLFRDEPLLVSNGDIYHTIDFLEFYRQHMHNGPAVSLAMHDFPRFNSVQVEAGKIIRFAESVDSRALAFTGLHVIDPAILWEIADNGFSCIIDHYRKLLARGVKIACYRTDGCYWTDMGTPEDYLALHEGLLTESIPCWQEIGPVSGPYCLADNVELGSQVQINGWASIGKAHIGKGSHLERVVLWDNVTIPDGSRLADIIVSS